MKIPVSILLISCMSIAISAMEKVASEPKAAEAKAGGFFGWFNTSETPKMPAPAKNTDIKLTQHELLTTLSEQLKAEEAKNAQAQAKIRELETEVAFLKEALRLNQSEVETFNAHTS